MKIEKEELNEKIFKLNSFLYETANINEILDEQQIENLHHQLNVMNMMKTILNIRITYDENKYK